MSAQVRVAGVGEIPPGSFKAVDAGHARVLVYNVDGEYYATSDTCVHQGGPLADGLVEGHTITCPWHAWQFDVRSGEAIYDPGVQLECHRVTVEGDEILLEV